MVDLSRVVRGIAAQKKKERSRIKGRIHNENIFLCLHLQFQTTGVLVIRRIQLVNEHRFLITFEHAKCDKSYLRLN